MKKSSARPLATFALGLSLTADLAAQTWDGGAGSGDWNTAANWNPDATPGSGANLTFAGSTQLTVTVPWAPTLGSITFGVGAGAFTLSGGGINLGSGGITNNSSNSQSLGSQLTLGAGQTWNAASGAIISTGYIGAGGNNLTLSGAHGITFSGDLNGVGSLTLNGDGARVFNAYLSANSLNINGGGATTFSGSSAMNIGGGGINVNTSGTVAFNGTINSGALALDAGTVTIAGSGNGNLQSATVNGGNLVLNQSGGRAINGNLTVNSGGSVLFEGDDQIRSGGTTVTLNAGAHLDLNDTEQSFQNLVISGDSVIDFGSSGSTLDIHSINFTGDYELTILNWNSAVDSFEANTNPGSGNLPRIVFDGYGETGWSGGALTPGAPIPEPRTYGLIAFGGLSAIGIWRRKRLRP